MAVNDWAEGWHRKSHESTCQTSIRNPRWAVNTESWCPVDTDGNRARRRAEAPDFSKGHVEVKPKTQDHPPPHSQFSLAVSETSHHNDSKTDACTHASVIRCHGNSYQHEQQLLEQSRVFKGAASESGPTGCPSTWNADLFPPKQTNKLRIHFAFEAVRTATSGVVT